MGKLLVYATEKDELDKKIADETRKLYLEGISYEAARKKAKDIFQKEIKKATKDTAK